jgi:steroid delta-isomerase-like uncharacterized protein
MKRESLVLSALMVFGSVTGCMDALDRNKDIVRRSHEEIWSKGNLELVDELYAEDFVCHFLVGPDWQGRGGLIEQVSSHRTSFPDWRERVVRLVAEGDFVVAHFSSSGTNTGEFGGNAPTGKRARIHEVAIYRIEAGQIAEQWGFPDIQGLSHQLGIAAPPTNMPAE